MKMKKQTNTVEQLKDGRGSAELKSKKQAEQKGPPEEEGGPAEQ
jgi:hypothetical protein